jgi:hypothetical protein
MRRLLILASLLATSLSFAAERFAGPNLFREPPIGRWLQPSTAPISPQARIFLVAGARDIANFAQEVVDQRALWLSRGYTPEQIECFFTPPPPEQTDDTWQFLTLVEALEPCHLASPPEVLSALKQVAKDYRAKDFFLYITSHGTPPIINLSEQVVRSIDPRGAFLQQAISEARADRNSDAYQWVAPFQVSMEGIRMDEESWGWASYFARLYQSRITSDMVPRDHMFTPALLAEAMQAFPAKVHKVVVIQACYSGGFILPAKEAPGPDETLRNVKKLTAITAARADRTSFGCDSSGDTTLFGRSFHKVLEAHPGKTVPQLDWRKLHKEVAQEVEQLEQEAGIPSHQRSEPQFFYGR